MDKNKIKVALLGLGRIGQMHAKISMKKRKLKVGDNEPYEGNLIGDTMYKHGLKNNLHHTLIEVRNDLLSSSTKIHRVSALLKQVINNSINRI